MHQQKNEIRSISLSFHKNQFKLDKRPKFKMRNASGKHIKPQVQATHFPNRTQTAQEIDLRNGKQYYMKLKGICTAKLTIKRMYRQPI